MSCFPRFTRLNVDVSAEFRRLARDTPFEEKFAVFTTFPANFRATFPAWQAHPKDLRAAQDMHQWARPSVRGHFRQMGLR
jgi:hypothetical protein